MKIGILVVAYNAVSTLAKVLRRIPPDAWERVSEVVVLDDASQDYTYELAVGYKETAQTEKLKIIRNQRNLGYGGNQKAGYRYFMENGFDVVVLLHGDGQYAPEFLPKMYGPIVAGEADAIFGSRMMKDFGGPLKGGMPLYKYTGNRILTVFENRALGLELTEFHSGYRAYSVECLRHIDFSRMTDDFHFDTEIIIKLQHQGFRIREVAIPTYYGGEICYVNGMKYAWNVARAVHRYRGTVRSVRKYPEFEEYWTRYPWKDSKYSSHYYLQRHAGTGHRVLDVGCGEGFVSRALAEAGNEVSGVDAIASPRHAAHLRAYYQRDLACGLEGIEGTFDRILLLDVLEHLPRPETILESCRKLLAPRGRVLVSLPNVANITVRAALLFGRFEYADRGIMDRTHLRFYTRKTARRMLERAGFEIARAEVTVMPVELVLGLPASNPLMVVLNRLLRVATRLLPGLLGYQNFFVLTAKQ